MRILLGAGLALLLGAGSARAAAIAWTGGASGDWNVAANWTPAAVPGAGDAVTIASGTVVAYATGPALGVASLTLGAAGVVPPAVLRLSTGLAMSGIMLLQNGAALQVSTGAAVAAADIFLLAGTSVAFVAAPSAAGPAPFLRLYASGSFNLSGGSTVTARGRGYASGAGASAGAGTGGGGAGSAGSGGGGGGHGAAGGAGGGAANAGTAFDALLPADAGGGGGGAPSADGGAGGGALFIAASTVTLDGLVDADGDAGVSGGVSGGGGGAGGAVVVDAAVIRGTGTVSARGGAGGAGTSFGGGGGGGGRLWIREQAYAALGSTLTIRASGGSFGAGGTPGAAGAAGTALIDPLHWTGGGADALASTPANWSGGAAPLGGARLVFGASATVKACVWDLSASPSGAIILPAFSTSVVLASSLTVAGAFDMAAGTVTAAAGLVLRVDGALTQTAGRLDLTASTIAVAAAGGAVAVRFFDAAARSFVVGDGVSATATVSGALTVSSSARVSAGAELALATGTLRLEGEGFSGPGGISASSGHWTVAGGVSTQTWTRFNGALGSLRVSNASGGLTLSTAAGSSFSLTGGLTVDSAAVLRAAAAALNVGGDWSVLGGALLGQSTVTFAGAAGSTLAVVAGGSFDALRIGGAGRVDFSTAVFVASALTVSSGTLDLGASTVNVRGNWTQAGGAVLGGTSRVLFNGTTAQAVAALPGGAFAAFVSSNPAGVTIASDLTVSAQFEWWRGPLNFAGRALSIGGDMTIMGGAGLTLAGSTVTFSGPSTQTVNFTPLDSVIVDNPSLVRLGVDSTWGAFTVNPGRYFDAGSRRLTITGARWSTAGAIYGSLAPHTVSWSPASPSIAIAAGSYVNARLELAAGKTAVLEGGLILDGDGNAFDPKLGSTVLNAAGGSTITFRGTSDLNSTAGPNWSYAGDAANSWLVYEGTGTTRGSTISTAALGSLQIALSSASVFLPNNDLNLRGSLMLSTGVLRLGARTIKIAGDLLQLGGDFDFPSSTGTIRLAGPSTQTLSLQPATTLWNLVAEGTGTVNAATSLRVRGDFTVGAGVFRAGAFTHSLRGNFLVGAGGSFDGQTSTVTLDGALAGASQSVSFLGGGAFHGLTHAVSSMTFLTSATAQILTDMLAGSTIAVAAGATLRVGDLRLGAAGGSAALRLRSTVPGAPWFLQVVSVSSVTQTAVSDSNASGGLLVPADDGRSTDMGGNVNWNFTSRLLLVLPGETLTPGVAPGKTGTPSDAPACSPVAVAVHAVSSRFDPVTTNVDTVTFASDDPDAAAPAPQSLVLGTTVFTLTPRGAEPSPRATIVNAASPFATGTATITVVTGALARLQVLLPGEAARPGSPTGKTGGAFARVRGLPFAATVRAVDGCWNVVSTITHTAALSVSASSAALPAPRALAAGTTVFSGIVVYSTGSFTLAATDATQPPVAGTSAVFGVSPPSLTSPTLSGFVPSGARVATLGGGMSGVATDGSAVERVMVDLRDLDAGLHFDWAAQAFALAAPSYATSTLGSPLTMGTTWFRGAADAAFADGHRFRLTASANNPSGLILQATSTFTFDRGMLAFGARDGQGAASVLPAAAPGCEELVSTVTYTVGASGIGPGGALAVRAPEGWTVPAGATTAYPPPLGYWHAASTSLAASAGSTSTAVSPAASGAVALGPGWLLLSVATGSAQSYLPGQRIVLTYRARPPFGPAGRGPQAFSLLARGDASGTLLPVSTAPVLTLGAGTTSFLTFADPSPLSLTPLSASGTMQLLVTDLCGNPAPGASSGTVSLSLSVLGGGGAVQDEAARFFNAAGAPVSSIALSTGLAAAASPAFSAWTSTDAPAELVLRATATFSGAGFSAIAVEAARPVRLRAALPAFAAVSIDTGTLSPGATSASLSAADPAGSGARIRFRFAEPDLAWEAVISTDGAGFASPVYSAVGAGDASRAIELAWDGLDRTQSPPVYAAAGRYKVRLRAAGGAAVNRSLEVVIPPTAGFAGRLGARGAGARVRASGPGAGDGRWAVASSTGYFELRGLRPAQAYALSASTAAVVLGRAVTLSTSIAAGPAGLPLSDLGSLSLPATAYLRVALLAPALSPREVLGGFVARLPDGTAAFSGSLRLSSGAASSDDAGPLFGRAASTWSVSAAPPGVYDVDIEVPDLGLSTRAAGVVVPAGGADLAVSLAKKTNVFGYVVLPTTVAFGAWVTVQASRAGAAEPSVYGGVFVSSVPSVSGPSSGAYALYGLDPGTWTVLARAPGFTASSAALLAAGGADLALDLAPGLGARLTGSLSVPGDTRAAAQCFPAAGGGPGACPADTFEVEVEALGVGRLDRAAARLRLGAHASFSSAAFTLSGLEAGTYVLRASLPGFGLVPPQGATVAVAAGGTAAASFSLAKLDARLRVDVAVPPSASGACRSTSSYRSLGLLLEPEGAAPLVFGDATEMAPVPGAPRSQVSTTTGAFLLLHCSSVTAFTPALPPGPVRVTALFAANGGLARGRLSLADGATAALSLDVSVATFAVSGRLAYSGTIGFSTRTAGGAPLTVAVSSIAGVLSAAPSVSFCLLGSGNPATLPALRAELLPYDPAAAPLRRAAAAAAGSCAVPAASTAPAASAAFIASIGPDGRFAFAGVSPGLYRLRVPGELDDDAANGPEAAEASVLIAVGTAPVTASLSLSRGRRVSGRIAAPAGLAAGRLLRVSLTDQEGREARSADVSCGFDGVPYALDGVPDGRYRLGVLDRGEPAVWTASPVEVAVAGFDLDGRDAALVAAATIRARLSLARALPGGAEEHVLVSRENAFLLPRGFSARATAVPYAAGGSAAARAAADGSIVDAEGRIVFSGLRAGTYDLEFAAPDDASPGALAFAPARVSGVTVAPGQAADLGVVPLFAGASVSGVVTDAATGLPVPGARVSARASLRSGAVEERRDGPTTVADAAGRYLLRGLSPVVRWYDLTASGEGHAPLRISSLDVSSGAARDFALPPAFATITGRVASSDGAPLFSALGGAAGELPGAALFLQRAGAVPADDPLADLALRTEPDGRFSIPSLATGAYRLTAAASGQASLTRSVLVTGALVDLGALTLGGGGAVSGALRLPDGAPVPDDELRAVAAVTSDLSEFIYGSVTRDAAARAAVAYKIGGLRAGRAYRVLALTAGDDAAAPSEAAAVVLTSTAEARVLDLVVRPPAPAVSARSRRSGARTTVEFLFSRPLRARSLSDDDPSLVVSTVSASGVLSGATLSSDRRRVTVEYDAGVGESSFTLRARAPTSALDYDAADPSAARELIASATAAFFTGETSAHRAAVANAVGGVLASEGDAGRLVLPRGAFLVDASSSVTVILRRAPTAVSAAGLPAALRAAAAALPASLPAQSDFYEIELPAGVPATLARPAQLTFVYSTGVADPSALNVYWYNPGSGQYVLQPDALGGAPALDASARSLTVNVGHFSTFVLLASGAGAIGGAAHAGELEAYNFPNPFDLQIKSVTAIHGAGVQSVRGTMIRVGVPPGLSGQGKLRVYDVTGRLIRSIDMGALAAGQSYYQGWDGRSDDGRDVASGLYIGSVEIGSRRKTFKMAVIK